RRSPRRPDARAPCALSAEAERVDHAAVVAADGVAVDGALVAAAASTAAGGPDDGARGGADHDHADDGPEPPLLDERLLLGLGVGVGDAARGLELERAGGRRVRAGGRRGGRFLFGGGGGGGSRLRSPRLLLGHGALDDADARL